jgi:nitrite reductase (NO-forming)
MPSTMPPRLSALLSDADQTTTRRGFLGASTLGLVVGGAALTACRTEAPDAQQAAPAPSDSAARAQALTNPNSQLDTALHDQASHTPQTAAAGAAPSPFHRFDPALPPLSSERTLRLNWRARELPVRITPDVTVAAWTFEGDIPGPIVHCRVGDTVEFTLTNEGAIPHSMDFHASQIDPKVAFRSVVKGQSVSFTFKPKWAGAFMYHCGSAPVLMHIGAGMYGALIVSPAQPLPAAREFVLVQSEFYLGDATNGQRSFDYNKMMAITPDYMAFNGRPLQYVNDPIRVKRGDRVRFWIVNCGPTHPSNFHVVGEQFDTVYLGAPPLSPIRGVQTFDVPAGGGMVFELLCDVAGEFPFVNHGFGHAQKGAIGLLVVE